MLSDENGRLKYGNYLHKKFHHPCLTGSWIRPCKGWDNWLYREGGPYHIETSPLICSANKRTGFYMIVTSITEELSLGTTYSVLMSMQQFSGGFVFSENTPIGVFSLKTPPPENSIITSSDKTSRGYRKRSVSWNRLMRVTAVVQSVFCYCKFNYTHFS